MNETTTWNLTLAAAVTVVVGSFMPWYSIGFFTASGTQGDGQFTAAMGALAGVMWLVRRPVGSFGAALAQVVLFALSGLVIFYHLFMQDFDDEFFTPRHEIGVWLVGLGAGVGFGTAVAALVGARRRKRSPTLAPGSALPPPSAQ